MSKELAEELREYTALKYMGDCKCGKCQLVPRELVDRIYAALRDPAQSPQEPTRAQIAQAFETIRLKLVNCLEEPERSAFWLAVQMRDALALPSTGLPAPAPHAEVRGSDTDHINWDIMAEERLGQRPVEHGRHIPQTSPAPGCDSGSLPSPTIQSTKSGGGK